MAIFSKNYTIPISRQIAKGVLRPTEPRRADIYLQADTAEINNVVMSDNLQFLSTIYSINKTKKSVVITTNTLNLLITDKMINGILLYQKVTCSSEDELKIVKEDIKNIVKDDYLVEDLTIYFNSTENFIKTEDYIKVITNVYDIRNNYILEDNVTIDRLKSSIRITIKTSDPDSMDIKLKSKLVFDPIVYNNWIEIPECVIRKLSGKYLHIFNHSYEEYLKVEVKRDNTSSIVVKDPIQSNTTGVSLYQEQNNFIVIDYYSYRSNLLFPLYTDKDTYLYFNLNGDNSNIFKISPYEINEEDHVLLSKISNNIKNISTVVNPYNIVDNYEVMGEKYTLLLENGFDKYKRPEDILLGNQRILLDLRSVMTKKCVYVCYDNGLKIYQKDNPRQVERTYDYNPINIIPQIYNPAAYNLINAINDGYWYDFNDPIKEYFTENYNNE